MKLMLPNASSDPRQRLKLLAIPLLGAFLIWRIWPSAAEEADSELAAAPQVATPSAGVPTPASSKASLPPVPEWTLEDALRFDPLKKLTVRVEPSEDLVSPSTEDAADDNARMEQAAFEERVAALESLKVDAILVNDAGAAALVGSRIVRVGDYLAEGARVIDVTAEGIRLRLEAEDAVQPSTAAEFVAKPRH